MCHNQAHDKLSTSLIALCLMQICMKYKLRCSRSVAENCLRFLLIRKFSHECYYNTFICDIRGLHYLLPVNINYCVNGHVFESYRFSIRNLSLLAECHLMVIEGQLDTVMTWPRILSVVIVNWSAAVRVPTSRNCS